MKKWIQKAIVQKTISYLPFSHKVNYLFQKYVTRGVVLSDEYFYDRLGHARDHLFYYNKYTGKPVPATSLEIGTGWYPIVPVSFFLAGAKTIYSVDISFLTSKERLYTTLNMIAKSKYSGKLDEYVNVLPERFTVLEELLKNYDQLSLEYLLKNLNITYLIEDARKLSLANDSIDLVNSNNTFEHIYPIILIPILEEFKRVVKPQGVMSHFIDMSDHFAHFDRSISIYNFLKFTPRQWQWIDNPIQPQNRLRIYDYKKIYEDLGIPLNDVTLREGNMSNLKNITLAEEYQFMPLEEIAVSHCYFGSDMNKIGRLED